MPKGFACRVERHSVSPRGRELFTAVIRFPRVMLAEAVTHRTLSESWGDFDCSFSERQTTLDLSKNSASSRAIPYDRLVKTVIDDPYMPPWTINQKGMQGKVADDPFLIGAANDEWLGARDDMVKRAGNLAGMGVHKQDCNRLLEPFGWVTQAITGDDIALANFFALRCHEAAYPSFRTIARMMFLAKKRSKPVPLEYGQWHLPFVPLDQQMSLRWSPATTLDRDEPLPDLLQFSAARCAWISYENHDRDGTPEAMKRTFSTLVGGFPKHASPIEHQGTPMHQTWEASFPFLRSNLRGWIQARKLIKMENVPTFDPTDEQIAAWGIDESKMWVEE